MTYDSEARIYVHGTLFSNCRIEIGGAVIPVPNDIAEVEITPKRVRGSHILPLVRDEAPKGEA